MSNEQKLREFSEWLDTYRDLPVHEVFHEIVLRYEEALATTEPAVNQQLTTEPLDERAAFESEMRSRHGWNNSYFTQSIDGGYLSNRATYAYIGWQARAALREKEARK